MDSVLITVRGGIAELGASPNGINVEIIDLDALREGAYDDIQRYWRDGLSARARRYVTVNHPDVARSVRKR
jgi:hypothetical protein